MNPPDEFLKHAADCEHEGVSLAVREIESRVRRDDDTAGAVEDHERAGDRSSARSAA